ncbi:unnamed protein product [Mytilus coruscus]|uniref:Novel STAND NTPase 3 domain-containing protein n=1 Tax=Mytilus coruscus TaxID=42192 RepID=A0A6J8ESY7_MYTCO|nr:unnamed protein product [Mytilus coruscus]
MQRVDAFSDVFETYIAHWFQEDRKFTVTSGTRKIEGMLKQNNCVLVVGRSGNGKSATVRHLALKHFDEEGFDIVPIVLPTTILQYYNPERKQLFIVDDFCGKNVINAQIVDNWSLHIHDVLKLLTNNKENNEGMSGQGTVKLVFATDPSIYKDTVFHRIHIPLECTFDLSNQPLQDEEKIEMFKKFRTEKKMSDDFTRTFQGHDNIFPLLCKYSEGKTEAQIIQLFTNPYNVIKQDFVALNKTNKDQMCLISLCILLESIHADVFRQENIHIKDKVVIDAVCSEFDLDFCNETTKSKLVAELNHLEKTYLAKTGDSYYIEHIDIYEIAAVVCGEVIKESFIRFAPSSMIAERYSFIPSETKDSTNLILIKDTDIQKRYFDRLMDDLERRITYSVFHNSQLKDKTYRDKFCEYCRRRQQKVKDLLNRLQKHTSEQSENQIDNTTEKGDNEYEDYIKFTEQYHFSTHRMQIPLIESTWEGYEDIVNLLIEMECDVNETDKFGRSSLFVACHLGRTNVAVQLLDKGAKHSLCDNNEAASPLHAACIGGDSKIVEALLAKGADTSARDKKGYSPFLAATEAGHKKILEKLLADKKNANINQKDNFDRSALFHASYNGRKEIVDLLLEKGADIEECDKQGFSPLLAACFMGKLNVVVDLLEKKADISKVDIDGRSALFMACEKGDNRIVEILLQKDADVSQCDWLQRSPLFIACTFEHEQIVRLLVKYKADISQCDQDGRSPLFIACEKGHDAIFNILLEKCQNDVLEKADHKDRSPLYVASRGGFLEIVKKLVSKGSKINKRNAWQMTPLFVACREGNADVVKYLIDSNADLNAADYNRQSPLSIACDNGYADVVTILVENDVNVYHADNDHKTPLELAENRGHTNIVDILNGVINRNRPYC